MKYDTGEIQKKKKCPTISVFMKTGGNFIDFFI
jgi:hypothetical protein